MGALAGVGILAGTAISAAGQYQAGEANEAIAKRNATLGRARAVDSIRRGKVQAGIAREQFKALSSEQDVGFATQNIQLNTGTPVEIRAETAMMAELEVNTILNNAAAEAWGFEQGAQESILSGEVAKASSRFGAAGTLFSGVGQAASAFQRPKAPEAPKAPAAPKAPRTITL